MGNIQLGVPPKLAIQLRDAFDINTFIETGTYKAGTTIWAAQNFKRVHSIEGFQEYYDKAIDKCAEYSNINLHFGDSRVELPRVLSKQKMACLIWLDAHWLGNTVLSAGTPGECPLSEELSAIENSKQKHIVLIDDAHCFLGELPKESDRSLWPTYKEIEERITKWGYSTFLFEDVIIAAPNEYAEQIGKFIKSPGIRVIVPTSNDYVNCMVPFAYLFNKYWSSSQPVTVPRYEIRPPKLPENFYKPSIGCQAFFTWSSGMAAFLNDYNSDLFILMLEDYFLYQPVDIEDIKQLWDFMESHQEIVKIDLSGDRLKYPHEDYLTNMIKSADDAPWQTSLQVAIWRKDFFLRFLDPDESAWEFEKEGTKRIIEARKAGDFEGIILGTKEPPLKYINAVGGHGTRPGLYDYKKFPSWLKQELQEKRLI